MIWEQIQPTRREKKDQNVAYLKLANLIILCWKRFALAGNKLNWSWLGQLNSWVDRRLARLTSYELRHPNFDSWKGGRSLSPVRGWNWSCRSPEASSCGMKNRINRSDSPSEEMTFLLFGPAWTQSGKALQGLPLRHRNRQNQSLTTFTRPGKHQRQLLPGK